MPNTTITAAEFARELVERIGVCESDVLARSRGDGYIARLAGAGSGSKLCARPATWWPVRAFEAGKRVVMPFRFGFFAIGTAFRRPSLLWAFVIAGVFTMHGKVLRAQVINPASVNAPRSSSGIGVFNGSKHEEKRLSAGDLIYQLFIYKHDRRSESKPGARRHRSICEARLCGVMDGYKRFNLKGRSCCVTGNLGRFHNYWDTAVIVNFKFASHVPGCQLLRVWNNVHPCAMFESQVFDRFIGLGDLLLNHLVLGDHRVGLLGDVVVLSPHGAPLPPANKNFRDSEKHQTEREDDIERSIVLAEPLEKPNEPPRAIWAFPFVLIGGALMGGAGCLLLLWSYFIWHDLWPGSGWYRWGSLLAALALIAAPFPIVFLFLAFSARHIF